MFISVADKGLIGIEGSGQRGEERWNVARLNVRTLGKELPEETRRKVARSRERGEGYSRYTRERVAHLNEDVKCFAANDRR